MPIITDMRERKADCLVTIGGGSLVDGAKIIIFVSDHEGLSHYNVQCLMSETGSRKRRPHTLRFRGFDRKEA